MKKKIVLFAGALLATCSLMQVTSATTFGVFPQGNANHVNLYVNDQLLNLDVPAKVVNNRTLVPLRGIFEAIGAQVQWESSTRSIVVTKDSTTIELPLNSTTAKVNGQSQTLDVAPLVVNDRTLVPVRFISEALGAAVGWDSGTQSVFISLRPLPSVKATADYLQSLQTYLVATDQAAKTATTVFVDYANKKTSYDQFKSGYDAQMKIMSDSLNSVKSTTIPDDSFAQAAATKFISVTEERYNAYLNRENAIYSDHIDSAALKNAYDQYTIVIKDIAALNVEYSN